MITRWLALVASMLLASVSLAQDWTPPLDPEPSKILKEAEEDARAGRHETALMKHIWYHRNALKHAPLESGSRLSSALASWKKLGESFPPALDEFKAERDRAGKSVLENRNAISAMADFANMNRELGEEQQTAELFAIVDREQPENAPLAYLWAENALIKNKRYDLYNKYCNPERSYAQGVEIYRQIVDSAKGQPWESSTIGFAEKSFTTRSATIVALLVINNRREEAMSIAGKARSDLKSEKHLQAIDEAIKGNLPDAAR